MSAQKLSQLNKPQNFLAAKIIPQHPSTPPVTDNKILPKPLKPSIKDKYISHSLMYFIIKTYIQSVQHWLYEHITSWLPNKCHSSCGQLEFMWVSINSDSESKKKKTDQSIHRRFSKPNHSVFPGQLPKYVNYLCI